jgi:hypothetical protein
MVGVAARGRFGIQVTGILALVRHLLILARLPLARSYTNLEPRNFARL